MSESLNLSLLEEVSNDLELISRFTTSIMDIEDLGCDNSSDSNAKSSDCVSVNDQKQSKCEKPIPVPTKVTDTSIHVTESEKIPVAGKNPPSNQVKKGTLVVKTTTPTPSKVPARPVTASNKGQSQAREPQVSQASKPMQKPHPAQEKPKVNNNYKKDLEKERKESEKKNREILKSCKELNKCMKTFRDSNKNVKAADDIENIQIPLWEAYRKNLVVQPRRQTLEVLKGIMELQDLRFLKKLDQSCDNIWPDILESNTLALSDLSSWLGAGKHEFGEMGQYLDSSIHINSQSISFIESLALTANQKLTLLLSSTADRELSQINEPEFNKDKGISKSSSGEVYCWGIPGSSGYLLNLIERALEEVQKDDDDDSSDASANEFTLEEEIASEMSDGAISLKTLEELLGARGILINRGPEPDLFEQERKRVPVKPVGPKPVKVETPRSLPIDDNYNGMSELILNDSLSSEDTIHGLDVIIARKTGAMNFVNHHVRQIVEAELGRKDKEISELCKSTNSFVQDARTTLKEHDFIAINTSKIPDVVEATKLAVLETKQELIAKQDILNTNMVKFFNSVKKEMEMVSNLKQELTDTIYNLGRNNLKTTSSDFNEAAGIQNNQSKGLTNKARKQDVPSDSSDKGFLIRIPFFVRAISMIMTEPGVKLKDLGFKEKNPINKSFEIRVQTLETLARKYLQSKNNVDFLYDLIDSLGED